MNLSQRPSAADVERWITEARDGNSVALNSLLAVCRPYLLMAANQDLDTALQARVCPDDVVQETLLETALDFPGFLGTTKEALLAWMRGILQNNLANLRRAHRVAGIRRLDCEVPFTQLPDLLDDPDETPSCRAQARERGEALEQALGRLPERYCRALLLRNREGLSFAAVGRHLSCSTEAARKLWSRARNELARLLSGKP